jgi:hypothetical protein
MFEEVNGTSRRKEMSSRETTDEPANEEESRDADHDSDSVASKLSKELSNWRRRRTSGRPRNGEAMSSSYQSDSARTIKVRGHETLVIRKPKLAKPTGTTTEGSEG